MKDIKLDFVNKKALNEFVDNRDRIHQQIIVGVRSFLGDFFLNDNYGVNYKNSWNNETLMKLFIKEQIEAIDGVVAVTDIQIKRQKDTTNRQIFVINANIRTIYETSENIIEILSLSHFSYGSLCF